MAPSLPPIERTALLLDLDGLLGTLHALRPLLGDALAVVTGRPVETIDALLGDAPFAVAGEHGGAIRYAPGLALERPNLPAPP